MTGEQFRTHSGAIWGYSPGISATACCPGDKELMEELLQYRFKTGELAGHSLGNLLLAALTSMTGSFDHAVRCLSKVLAIRGQVLPVTLSDVTLCAELEDGTVVQGQSRISHSPGRIKRVFLKPSAACRWLGLLAIRSADAVVLGPGSLYTSIIPNLLVKDRRHWPSGPQDLYLQRHDPAG